MIRISGLTLKYGRNILLENVNAEIPEGRLTAMLGCNGSGKSSLLRVLSGQHYDYSGEVLHDGVPLRKMPVGKLALAVSIVNTDRIRIPGLTCRELVALGRAPYTDWTGRLARTDSVAVSKVLEFTGMESYAGRTMDEMSDGECQMVMVARALAQDTPVMLLDEPAAFLDLPNKYRLAGLLKKMSADFGKTVVFSTHDLDIALDAADELMILHDRNLIFEKPDNFVASGLMKKVFSVQRGRFCPETADIDTSTTT